MKIVKVTEKFIKRIIDFIGSMIGLIILLPVFVWVAILIYKEDGLPIIYSQDRIGLNGRTFKFYKFRSMYRNADKQLEAWRQDNNELWKNYINNNFKLENDPRILKIGHFIRRKSIDELPQLINVIIGNMSLVGPRPLLPREIKYYGENVEVYFGEKPGITGLWQINGRSNTTFAQRVEYDELYAKNRTIVGDIILILKTISVVLTGVGAY